MLESLSSKAETDFPSKTIAAPDGSTIRYPNLPNLGEGRPVHEVGHTHRTDLPIPAHHEDATLDQEPRVAAAVHADRLSAATRAVARGAEAVAETAYRAFLKDDVDKLVSPHRTVLDRVVGAADLASWALPEGKAAELAGHAIVQAGEFAATHLASVGVERTAEHAAEAIAVGRTWGDRTPNEKLAEQHFRNESTIWDRPLTASERTGTFQTADDLRAFLGPASNGRSAAHDWHHVVESQTANRFGVERVHSIENVGALERKNIHKSINNLFSDVQNSEFRNQSGEKISLRDFLKDKPWERHVAVGERLLTNSGADLEGFRATALERFPQRLHMHDHQRGPNVERLEHESHKLHVGAIPLGGVVSDNRDQSVSNSKHFAEAHLTIFQDGKTATVGEGHHQSGKVHNVGLFVAIDDGKDTRESLTLYPRSELLAQTPPEARHALAAALRDGHTVDLTIGSNGLAVHDVTPTRQQSLAPARERAAQRNDGGHQLGL